MMDRKEQIEDILLWDWKDVTHGNDSTRSENSEKHK